MTEKGRQHLHLGAYGLVVHQSDVLLVLKSRGAYIDSWDLPGGRIEFGESPEAALIRELKEETGYEAADAPQLIAVKSHTVLWSFPHGVQEHLHHLGCIYRILLSEDRQPPIVLREDEDAAEVAWKSLEDAADLPLTPFAREILRNLTLYL